MLDEGLRTTLRTRGGRGTRMCSSSGRQSLSPWEGLRLVTLSAGASCSRTLDSRAAPDSPPPPRTPKHGARLKIVTPPWTGLSKPPTPPPESSPPSCKTLHTTALSPFLQKGEQKEARRLVVGREFFSKPHVKSRWKTEMENNSGNKTPDGPGPLMETHGWRLRCCQQPALWHSFLIIWPATKLKQQIPLTEMHVLPPLCHLQKKGKKSPVTKKKKLSKARRTRRENWYALKNFNNLLSCDFNFISWIFSLGSAAITGER